ncbi:MAG: hypothetical protein ACI4IE_08540 [Eubacterium sp.]
MAKRNNGEGTITKRKDGRWEGRYYTGEIVNGKRVRKNVLAKTKAEYEEQQNIMNRCSYLKNGDPTLREWYEIWHDSFLKATAMQSLITETENKRKNELIHFSA